MSRFLVYATPRVALTTRVGYLLCLTASAAAAIDGFLHPTSVVLLGPIWVTWYVIGAVVSILLAFINVGTRKRYGAAKRSEANRLRDTPVL